MKETKDMTEVHTIADECGILGYAAATNPRVPEELTLTLPNGITLLATASSLEEARAILAIETSGCSTGAAMEKANTPAWLACPRCEQEGTIHMDSWDQGFHSYAECTDPTCGWCGDMGEACSVEDYDLDYGAWVRENDAG